jgi:hypothetical protein
LLFRENVVDDATMGIALGFMDSEEFSFCMSNPYAKDVIMTCNEGIHCVLM